MARGLLVPGHPLFLLPLLSTLNTVSTTGQQAFPKDILYPPCPASQEEVLEDQLARCTPPPQSPPCNSSSSSRGLLPWTDRQARRPHRL